MYLTLTSQAPLYYFMVYLCAYKTTTSLFQKITISVKRTATTENGHDEGYTAEAFAIDKQEKSLLKHMHSFDCMSHGHTTMAENMR